MYQEAEENPSLNPLYGKIWGLETAPKIKVFLWKMLKGAIAVEDRLRTRGIKIADGCLMCGEPNETINHILFQCPLARQVWALSLTPSPLNGFGQSIYANLNHLLQICHSLDIQQHIRNSSLWILWVLWKNRNKMLFQGFGSVTNCIVEKAMADCTQWILAQQKGLMPLNTQVIEPRTWIPPKCGELKCNIGMAWSKKQQLCGASWVVRDSQGLVLMHSRRSYTQVQSKFEAKINSWTWALQSMNQLHLEKVVFGDSSIDIIKALWKPKEWPSIIGHIAELLSFTKNHIGWFMAMETTVGNRAALEIAKSAITGYRWQSYVAKGHPLCLKTLFQKEKVQ